MQVFVTGGAGFIGQHLVTHLLEKKNKVTIYDNLKNNSKESISNIKKLGAKLIKGDVTNFDLVKKSITGHDMVIHLAAQINVQDSIKNPQYTNNVNVTGTLNVLQACVEKNIKNIIAPSSAAVYGDQKIFQSLKTPTQNQSPHMEQQNLQWRIIYKHSQTVMI